MFKVSPGQAMQSQVNEAEKNYVIQPNDLLQLKVFTNGGERVIDPDLYLRKDIPQNRAEVKEPDYLVNSKGIAKFPMIGELNINGLTIRQAEAVIQQEYGKYYTNPFAILTCSSKRVVILGAPGGQVIPLAFENMRLVEVLALAKGVENNARATNIRVLRGDSVFVANLTTFEGYKKDNMIMKPGDIVYVEPIRKPFVEGFREYGPVISIVTSLTTLVVLLSRL